MEIKKRDTKWLQDTCLALEPIIGQQASQIWQTYLLSDEETKRELEETIELLSNLHLHGDVENKTPVFRVPKQEQAAGPYGLGQVVHNGKRLHPFGLRDHEMFQHCAIFGRSGSGKTNLAFLLIQNLVKQKKPFLIFDWKRNFRDLVALPGFENLEVYTVGRDVAPFAFNPLMPPQGIDPKTWLKKLIYVIAHAFFLGDGSMFLLQQAIDYVYRKAGMYEGKVDKYPTFRDVLKWLGSRVVKGRESLWMASVLRSVFSLCFGQMDAIVNSHSNQGLDGLLERLIVFEVDSLTQADKIFFTDCLLLWTHAHSMIHNKREEFRHAIVIEEAHHILSCQRKNAAGGEFIVETILREIREFGEAIILLDQHPSQISLTALGNTYATICMNLKSKRDVSVMESAMLLDGEQRQALGNMEVGKALVKLQGRVPEPFMIQVPEFKIQKGSVSDALIAPRMPKTRKAREEPPESLSELEKAFLQDIGDHPDSGVAARYKRLGLSCRRGDQTKRQLVEKKMITERRLRTSAHSKKVFQVTKKSRLLLP